MFSIAYSYKPKDTESFLSLKKDSKPYNAVLNAHIVYIVYIADLPSGVIHIRRAALADFQLLRGFFDGDSHVEDTPGIE